MGIKLRGGLKNNKIKNSKTRSMDKSSNDVSFESPAGDMVETKNSSSKNELKIETEVKKTNVEIPKTTLDASSITHDDEKLEKILKKCHVKIKKENLMKILGEHNKKIKRRTNKTSSSKILKNKVENVKNMKAETSSTKGKNAKSRESKTAKSQKLRNCSSPIYIRLQVDKKGFANKQHSEDKGVVKTSRNNFKRSFLKKKFGSKYFLCRVKVKRLRHPLLDSFRRVHKINRKTVSFVETVEVFGGEKVDSSNKGSTSVSDDEVGNSTVGAMMTSTPLMKNQKISSTEESLNDEHVNRLRIRKQQPQQEVQNANDKKSKRISARIMRTIDVSEDSEDGSHTDNSESINYDKKKKKTDKLGNNSIARGRGVKNDKNISNGNVKKNNDDDDEPLSKLQSKTKQKTRTNSSTSNDDDDDDEDGNLSVAQIKTKTAYLKRRLTICHSPTDMKKSKKDNDVITDDNSAEKSDKKDDTNTSSPNNYQKKLKKGKMIELNNDDGDDDEIMPLSELHATQKEQGVTLDSSISSSKEEKNNSDKSPRTTTTAKNSIDIRRQSVTPTTIHGRKTYRTDQSVSPTSELGGGEGEGADGEEESMNKKPLSPLLSEELTDTKGDDKDDNVRNENENDNKEKNDNDIEKDNKTVNESTSPSSSTTKKQVINEKRNSFDKNLELIESDEEFDTTDEKCENNHKESSNTDNKSKSFELISKGNNKMNTTNEYNDDIIKNPIESLPDCLVTGEDVLLTANSNKNLFEKKKYSNKTKLPAIGDVSDDDDDDDDDDITPSGDGSIALLDSSQKSSVSDLFDIVKNSKAPKETRLTGGSISGSSQRSSFSFTSVKLSATATPAALTSTSKPPPTTSTTTTAVFNNVVDNDFPNPDEFLAAAESFEPSFSDDEHLRLSSGATIANDKNETIIKRKNKF